MRRRDFIKGISGSAITWPLAAHSQQAAMPVIGYLGLGGPDGGADIVAAIRRGLGEVGLVEGRDFTIEFRWARYDADRLPALAVDLVQRRVAVIIAFGSAATVRAARVATTEIPIVFAIGTDPVQAGLVASLNRPGGNLTGTTTMNLDLESKWVGLLHELLPAARDFAVLVNIVNADSARRLIVDTQAAGRSLGIRTEFLFASVESEIATALDGLGGRSQALIIHPDIFFLPNCAKVAALAIREKLPTIYAIRDFPAAGGLMSYGSSFFDADRQAGVYAGHILKGEKPSDLPIQQAAKFDFVINLKTSKTIGLDIPATLLARADEVIE